MVMSITLSSVSQERLDDWRKDITTYTSLSNAASENPENVIKLSLFYEKIDNWESVCQYKKLEGLELIDMFGENFPVCILELVDLKFLSLRNNKLYNLPKEIVKLKNIEFLNLYWNENLKELPQELTNLTSIRYINIGGNPNMDWGSTFSLLSKLPNLKSIALSFNNIKALPSEVGLLTQVEELIIDNNLMKNLPNEMSKMKNLKRIVLTNNSFTTMSKVIATLLNLEEIVISNTYEEDHDKSLAGRYGHNRITDEDILALRKANPNLKVTMR